MPSTMLRPTLLNSKRTASNVPKPVTPATTATVFDHDGRIVNTKKAVGPSNFQAFHPLLPSTKRPPNHNQRTVGKNTSKVDQDQRAPGSATFSQSLPKLERTRFPQSESRKSFIKPKPAITELKYKKNYSSLSKEKVAVAAKSLSCTSGFPGGVTNYDSENNLATYRCKSPHEGGNNYEVNRMKPARSEFTLLEQKKQQWAKEREELNGLWSPWGRQQPDSTNRLPPSKSMQTTNFSPTNVVSSSYIANLGIGSPTYTSMSHSECYLPPINPTIAQQPRQKAKVWNAEFQQEDYRYENESSIPNQNGGHYPNRGVVHPRKASLPNYMYGAGDGYSANYPNHPQMVGQHSRLGGNNHARMSVDEEALTSGYYSENNNGDEEQSKQIVLKPTSRERTYQEEVTIQKAIAFRGEQNVSPRVIVHKIYTQNGEMIAEHDGGQDVVIVNNMMVSNTGQPPSPITATDYNFQSSTCVPGGNLPRNHAMRSSLTIGVDSNDIDSYNEIQRREKEKWLIELEKQREEQRLRKLMEKEERRPRWGDRGVIVGHFWEPSDSENSHLPAPPHNSRAKGGGSSVRGESVDVDKYVDHQRQSHTPPAWLEKGLTRMQSSKSQPSLHDPEYNYEADYATNNRADISSPGPYNRTSGRSINHSAIDLRDIADYNSPAGDPQHDRCFVRGQNAPIDPDTFTEREKKRLANQEHLDALKKQIEERQQKQKEEKERELKEEQEYESRFAKQHEVERQRVEMEKRGKMLVNGDMPNCVGDDAPSGEVTKVDLPDTSNIKISAMLDRANIPVHDSKEEKDIEIVQRQSMMVVAAPSRNGEDEKTGESSESSNNPSRIFNRQDQGVMTDTSDPIYERTLTPSIQRSRSLSMGRSSREFGTQTELSDGSSSTSGSPCGSGKNSDQHRSHNSLLDKKSTDKKHEKKSEERPRWGSNPIKKQYIKQSEKDPNYISRVRRRQDRLKRMEDERTVRGDTGTESEDVNIPFHRIRQRRHDISPQRRRGITPMKATPLEKTDINGSTPMHIDQVADKHTEKVPPSRSRISALQSMKTAKSETQLSKQRTTADILDRNFGSVAGISGSGTSEESSGFSTPFMQRREIGSGSTGSGTTGSGSGIQSPDLPYHTYQAAKSNKEDRKFTKITSGRDTHATSLNSSRKVVEEFTSTQKGFIHQRDFDEIPIQPKIHSFSHEDVTSLIIAPAENSIKNNESNETNFNKKSNENNVIKKRNSSLSPQKKPKSPVKVRKPKDMKNCKSKAEVLPSPRTAPVSNETEMLPDIHQGFNNNNNINKAPSSPPVPALLSKMQMGLQPDESGRISSLPSEFPDILAPLPNIPIGTLLSPNPSRLSSAVSSIPVNFDIDIAVTPRNNPEILRLFEAAEEKIKQRQLNAIASEKHERDSARSRRSFEADIGSISINLEPVMMYPTRDMETTANEIPRSASLSIKARPVSNRPAARDSDSARHEAFIASILNRHEVKQQLSARESELSEKGIIEFSIRLPSTTTGSDDEYEEEYQDPLLSERRRHTTQWLYGGQTVPQKQAILTNLASLKKGIAMQQETWKVGNSDTE